MAELDKIQRRGTHFHTGKDLVSQNAAGRKSDRQQEQEDMLKIYEVIMVMEKVDRNQLLISVENWVLPD